MAHKLMGNRFISRTQSAWHNIAKRIFKEDERISASEAMKEVAGDIVVVRAPLVYELDGVTHDAKHIAIVRKPTHDDPRAVVFGVSSEKWHGPSYIEMATALDPLSAKYRVETAGLMEDGGTAFICLRGEDYSVRGDEMRNYFSANFSLTPGRGHHVLQSDVRVVCWNTNQMSIDRAKINLSVPHTADAKQRIELAGRLVTQFAEMKDKAKEIFEAFADRPVSDKDVDSIIYAAFQLPKLPPNLRLLKQQLSETESQAFKRALSADLLISLEKAQESYDNQCDKITALRTLARERFEAFEPARLRGTAWAAYNAVTEVADWREGRGADQSALFGGRAAEKTRAYEAAMSLIVK